MTDLGVVQTPMFHAGPARFAWLLPGYGPTRVVFNGAYSTDFTAGTEFALAIAWAATLALAVHLVLSRALQARS